MDEIKKMMRVGAVFRHQSRQGGAVIVEIIFLDAMRLMGIHIEELPDVQVHPGIDQRKEITRGRVKRVVEIKDPSVDMGEGRRHSRPLITCLENLKAAYSKTASKDVSADLIQLRKLTKSKLDRSKEERHLTLLYDKE